MFLFYQILIQYCTLSSSLVCVSPLLGLSTGKGLLRIRQQWKVFRLKVNRSMKRTMSREYLKQHLFSQWENHFINSLNRFPSLPACFTKHNSPGGIPARSEKGERLLLFIGIIDILQSYRLRKKLEHTWKSIIHDGVSIESIGRVDPQLLTFNVLWFFFVFFFSFANFRIPCRCIGLPSMHSAFRSLWPKPCLRKFPRVSNFHTALPQLQLSKTRQYECCTHVSLRVLKQSSSL